MLMQEGPPRDAADHNGGGAHVARTAHESVHMMARMQDRPPLVGMSIIVIVALLLTAFFLWAHFTEIDEVTRGQGKVIPSSKTQIVQSAEAGVIAEIMVRAGQRVGKGDILARLDDTSTSANLGEQEARARALEVQIARLDAEQSGQTGGFDCPADIKSTAPEICANELSLMQARRSNLETRTGVFATRVEQRRRELNEARSNVQRSQDSLNLAQKELELLKPLAARKIVAQTDLIAAERQVSDLSGEVRAGSEAIARIEASLREAELQVQEQKELFRQDAVSEMTQKMAELSVVSETRRGAADRVKRTDIASPVDGIVNTLDINTIGAFVNAGTKILDIVPVDDKLLIEARIKPSDIAFIVPGQKAQIKITAYDFSIFGGLEGEVTTISPDSILDEQSRETYYTVLIRSEQASLERNGKTYPIFPGMVSQVDILTGRKSILAYLLKPINKARQEALRER